MSSGPAARVLRPTPVRTGAGVLELLDPLRAALSGAGPALALQAAGAVPGPDRPLRHPDDDEQDPTVAAVTTSGSTGAAKTVLLPASALLASAAATHDRLGGAGQWLLALPAQHVAGLQVLVRSLVARTRPVVIEPGAFTPAAFVAATEGMSPTRTRYTSLVPTQLVRLLDDPDAIAALRGFRAVLVGGAGTPAALLAKAKDAGVPVVTTYGMSETCGGCVYDDRPLDGVQIRLDRDPGPDSRQDGRPDGNKGGPQGGPGRILIGGPVLARGYLDDQDGTGRVFQHDGTERWFRTDDAGATGFGKLAVLGRLDDMIVTGGVNVAPGPIEAVLHEWPQVREAVVIGVPDPEWGQRVAAAVVLGPGLAAPELSDVRTRIRAALGPASAPHQLTVLEELPLRGPGKPDRSAIAALLASRHP